MHKPAVKYLLSWNALALLFVLYAMLWTASTAKAVSEPPLTIVEPLTFSTANPSAGQLVTATFALRNDGTEPVYLIYLGAGGRAPGCVDFDCPEVENFALATNVTIAPGETFNYAELRTFIGEGMYFFQLTYEAVIYQWRFIGERVDVNVGPGLRLATPLTLTPVEPAPGEPVEAEFVLTNAGPVPISIQNLIVGARGPNCSSGDWSCTNRPDYINVGSMTLDPGESYAYYAPRQFEERGSYFVQVSFIDEAGEWQQLGERVDFNVVATSGQDDVLWLYLPAIQK